ncbi:MAG: hypothetical protein LBB60_10990, partial [Desulfovibrio sp.]|nr:hypothetical protein [Desulfovibrio sp.]
MSQNQEDTQFARRVKVHVTIGGHDATDYLQPYLLDFSFTDNAGKKADEVQITLHDRDGKWNSEWMPKKGMEVDAIIECMDWFKPGENVSLPCGSFRIDELEFSGPPDKVTIKAVTSALTTGLRDTSKTRAWENTGLQTVAGQIAEENDLELMYEDDDDDNFERQDQRDESDLAFIDRLAEERGMYCKAHDGKLILVNEKAAEQARPVLTVSREGAGMLSAKSWNFKQSSSKTGHRKASVSYTDPAEGVTHTAEVQAADAAEKDEKTLALNQRVESSGQAIKGAASALHKSNKKENTATVEVMGHPGIVAGITLDLTGFGDFSGRYIVKKAEHKVGGSGGYATSLELSKCRLMPDVVV